MIDGRDAPSTTEPRATLSLLRGALLIILVVGLVGVLLELLLLEHFEDVWQRVPVFLLSAAIIVAGWHGFDRGALSVRALRWLMVLFIVSGAIGLFLHFDSNMQFELEMDPNMTGTPLLWASLMGAIPALAPGTMVQLGLIGLAYTLRHPALHQPNAMRDPTMRP
jgi:hypothetical protein